jgi:hypothetical protein
MQTKSTVVPFDVLDEDKQARVEAFNQIYTRYLKAKAVFSDSYPVRRRRRRGQQNLRQSRVGNSEDASGLAVADRAQGRGAGRHA